MRRPGGLEEWIVPEEVDRSVMGTMVYGVKFG